MKAALTVSLLLAAVAAVAAAHAAAPAIAPPGTATLEALLACKAGSNFSEAEAIDALQAAGLARKPGARSSRRSRRSPCSAARWPAPMST